MSNIKYLSCILLIAALANLAIFATNYVVDPYGVFHNERIQGFNHKLPANRSKRTFRPLEISQVKDPDILVLGSSRGTQLYDAAEEFWPNENVINASISALRAREAIEFIEFYAEEPSIKTIIYQPDFFSFNDHVHFDRGFLPGIVSTGKLWRLQLLALQSFSALLDSIETVRQSSKEAKLETTKNTALHTSSRDSSSVIIREVDESADASLKQLETSFELQLKSYLSSHRFYQNYSFDRQAVILLEKVLQKAKRNGKEVLLLTGPSHAWQWEAVRASGNSTNFDQWKTSLTTLATANKINFFDFATYSPISTVPLSKAKGLYPDSSHFSAQIGMKMLRCIFENTECSQVGGRAITDQDALAAQKSFSQKQAEEWRRAVSQNEKEMFARSHPDQADAEFGYDE